MAWDERKFDDRLSNLKKTWEMGEKCGVPNSEADKTLAVLSLELDFSGKPLVELESIAWHTRQWLETKNPHHIDFALLCCRNAGIDHPPTLLSLVVEVAALRAAGLECAGTSLSIRNNGIHAEALRIVCLLHLAGQPIDSAASKAARNIADRGLGKVYKASTLERDYRVFRKGKPSLEADMRAGWGRASEETREIWRSLGRDLPEADDDLKGNLHN